MRIYLHTSHAAVRDSIQPAPWKTILQVNERSSSRNKCHGPGDDHNLPLAVLSPEAPAVTLTEERRSWQTEKVDWYADGKESLRSGSLVGSVREIRRRSLEGRYYLVVCQRILIDLPRPCMAIGRSRSNCTGCWTWSWRRAGTRLHPASGRKPGGRAAFGS
jgi:hypothetical protein